MHPMRILSAIAFLLMLQKGSTADVKAVVKADGEMPTSHQSTLYETVVNTVTAVTEHAATIIHGTLTSTMTTTTVVSTHTKSDGSIAYVTHTLTVHPPKSIARVTVTRTQYSTATKLVGTVLDIQTATVTKEIDASENHNERRLKAALVEEAKDKKDNKDA
ncbi:hypothetical protein BC940DRAFT_350256 [Gongronella butleri]|nr:hypothetical protein BC940DRAFT_350256 [Gongronella butleri]